MLKVVIKKTNYVPLNTHVGTTAVEPFSVDSHVPFFEHFQGPLVFKSYPSLHFTDTIMPGKYDSGSVGPIHFPLKTVAGSPQLISESKQNVSCQHCALKGL